MTDSTQHPAELFLRFSRRSVIALLATVILLGGAALSLMLSPSRAFFETASKVSLVAVAVALLVTILVALHRRRWPASSPAVQVVMDDEMRRASVLRASRAALITVLLAQYPLVLLFGFFMELPAPRGAFAMGAATVTLGLITLLSLFLYFDRDPA
ncbi:MAG TPA: hypothetical protein VM557_03570 [Thermoanaerobaculia bacterium]|nr:hypothetical protein [Thermoanaerobaculia bacterium]